MATPVIAIADDDVSFGNYLKSFLEGRGFESRTYGHGEQLLASARLGELPDVVLLDVMMPGMDGLATLRQLKAVHPELQVIMLSGLESAPIIVEALKLGAANYVVKPGDPGGLGEIALEAAIRQAIENRRLAGEVSELRRRVHDDQAEAFLFLDQSEAMRAIGTVVDRVADSDVTVLIRGESGVGKELVARAIHERSMRRARPFLKVNCAALPDELLESELFGHEKGAFTGAGALRIGKFEYARGGSLLLDEIGEMKAGLQGKLLHVLQDGEYSRLGSNKAMIADVRVIAATNRDLEVMLARSQFREDLYYRLRVIEIVVPPLRERRNEIPHLFDFFVEKYSKRYTRPRLPPTPALLEALLTHSWPGNIRELENMVKRYVILQDEAQLLRELQSAGTPAGGGRAHLVPPGGLPDVPPSIAGAVARSVPAKADSAGNGHRPDAPTPSLADAVREAVERAERDLLIHTLRRVHWNRRKAAPLLGISYKTLLNKIKEYGIVPEN
jgi:two-component system response regulator AtoC